MNSEPADTSGGEALAFIGREGFRAQLRSAFARAASDGWLEFIVSDSDFEDWPLGDAAVIDALQAWAGGRRRLIVLARTYERLPRSAARFVEWRRQWAHLVECRQCRDAEPGALPSAFWAPSWSIERLDLVRHSGRVGGEARTRLLLRQRLDEWLARSVPGFPAYPLGL